MTLPRRPSFAANALSALAATAALLPINACSAQNVANGDFRPPAVPLVTSDPYLSIWSEADHLNDDSTRHWTHRDNPLVSLIRVDGAAYRLMGKDPAETPAFPQTGLTLTPTRSIYTFSDTHVQVTMTFMDPALPHDIDVLSRPVGYITWDVKSVDGKKHDVSLYDSVSGLLTVNQPGEIVQWGRDDAGSLTAMHIGSVAQTIFSPAGDDTRINWGYAYLAAPSDQVDTAIGGDAELLNSFTQGGTIPAMDESHGGRAANDDQPVMALTFRLGGVGDDVVSRHVMVALDEIYEVKFFGEKLRPYWKRNDMSAPELLQTSEKDYRKLIKSCTEFDSQLMADLTKVGGPEYARVCALAYRQCLCGCGIAADRNKQPLLFTKENSSNGDIATMDVIFPMDPMLIALSPTLAKASIVPILEYGSSPRWKFPNAPHDLGTYPVARGTDDGGEQMPVEESGNIILIADAIAQEDGNANWVTPWWSHLEQWAQYLEQYGLDPEEQLCTDDFMGHLAHNSNLSVKAILALAAYADMCKMRGETANYEKYHKLAVADAAHWVEASSDGDHSRLAFDKPNTWSQKYNLVWDKILGLNVFPPTVAAKEVAYYKAKELTYGFPLDSRTKLTKTDWSFWSAALATDQADFLTLTQPIYAYLNQTAARLPFVDSYTTDSLKDAGLLFRARPVIGGVFIKMLSDRDVWMKWAKGDPDKAHGWAELPVPPVVTEVVPSSRLAPQTWHYTETNPGGTAWTQTGFDDSAWKTGAGPFASAGTPGINPGTEWRSDDIWIRRTFTVPDKVDVNDLQLVIYHDEDVDVYFNGVLAHHEAGYENAYVPFDILGAAKDQLHPGATITLAVHCHQTTGGQGVDVGLVTVKGGK